LVCALAAFWCPDCIHRMKRVNSSNSYAIMTAVLIWVIIISLRVGPARTTNWQTNNRV